MASPKYPLSVWVVAAALKNRYRDFNHHNLKNPLDELLFIICSTKTGEASYRSTFRSLKETFPTHLHIAEAPAKYIARPIVSGGLSNQKAEAIRVLTGISWGLPECFVVKCVSQISHYRLYFQYL